MPAGKTLTIEILYRLCKADDLDGLEWHGLFSHDREILRAAYCDQQRGQNLMLLAILNAMPVGQVWIDLRKRSAHGAAFIWAVRVIPWLQGLGIGSDLMLHAEHLSLSAGFSVLELAIDQHNDRAQRFYQRLGYHFLDALAEHSSRCDQRLMRKTLAPVK